jgi:hypothetical protein
MFKSAMTLAQCLYEFRSAWVGLRNDLSSKKHEGYPFNCTILPPFGFFICALRDF